MASTLALLLLSIVNYVSAGEVTGTPFNVPTGWVKGKDFVVVNNPKVTTGNTGSSYGGYIWPGPDRSPGLTKLSVDFSSADGYYCEAKNYDTNFGIWETQECANKWNRLVTQGDSATDVDLQDCKTVATRPCGCQNVCRPVECNAAAIKDGTCKYETQCRAQEQRGIVTSCAAQATFQISMWFGILFAVIIVFAAYSMMNMSLDMDSLLYTVGEPDKKDN